MKNLRKGTMLSLLLFLFAIITSACGSGGGGNGGEFMYLPNFVTLSKDKFEINIGQKDKVTAYIGGIDITKEATFEIVTESNQKDTVATIDNDGTITAIAVGTANIKVSYKQAESANFNVLVKDPTIPNTEVKTNDIYYELGDDTKDIDKIVVTVNGKDKTNEAQFFSSDESVVKVDRNGKITFVGEGTATIIVHVDGANDSIININVQKPQLDISIDEDKIEFGKEFYIELGETEQLNVKLREEDKTSKATYTSSDPSVVTVDENGNITALKEGEAEITVIVDGAKEAKIPIVVPHQGPVYPEAGIKILLGNTDKLDILLRGENVTSQCPLTIHKIHEDDPDVISIDEQGNITSIATGEVLITTICNGDEITIPIKVYDELTTVARNDNGDIIQAKTKYINDQNEIDTIQTMLHDTGIIENKDDIQKVIEIDNIDDINNLNIDIDLEDGTTVAIVHRQEDGSYKYLSTETVQDKKITKNDIVAENIQEIAFNILLGNTVPFEIDPYELVENNDGVVYLDDTNKTIKGDKTGTAVIKTTYNGQETFIKINVYDTVTTNATNSNGESIEVNTKILSESDTDNMKNILYYTGIIENKEDVQKVIEIDNIDDLNSLDIDIDLEDGTTVAIVHKQEDGTYKYISTETVQGKKITKNDIQNVSMEDVIFNVLLGNTIPFEIDPYELLDNDGVVDLDDNNKTIKGIKPGIATIKTTINGEDSFVKINVYNSVATTATNSTGEAIEVNTKILSEQETGNIINLLYYTGMIESKNDVQKVIAIDNIDDLNSLDIDIDLADGTKVAIVHRQEDGTLKYLSTETVQSNKITQNNINTNIIKEVNLNILVGNTVPFEMDGFTVAENNGIVTIANNTIRGDKAGTAILKTTIDGEDIFVKANVGNSLTTTATNTNGQSINVNTKLLSDAEKDVMITRLLDTGMISNENDVDDVVQMNQADGVGTVTIYIDRPDGTKVAVVGQDGDKIKYVQIETVNNGQITVNAADSNKTVFAQENQDGTFETIITPGFYNANNKLLASWDEVVSWGWDYRNTTNWDRNENIYYNEPGHFYSILSNHSDLKNATKLVIPNGVTEVHTGCFANCSMNLNTVVYPDSYSSANMGGIRYNSTLQINNFTINSTNPNFNSFDGVIYTENGTQLVSAPNNRTTLTVRDGTQIICSSAFYGNIATSIGPIDSGAGIQFPSSVTTIVEQSFGSMTNLVWFEGWTGLTTMNQGCFSACNNLHSVYIPNTVTSITKRNNGRWFSILVGTNVSTLCIEPGVNTGGWCDIWNTRDYNGSTPITPTWNISRATYRASYR